MKLTTKLSLIVGGISAFIAILSAYAVLQIAFVLTENRIKENLIVKHKAVELLASPENSTELATYLRSNDLSLLIFDEKQSVVARYGIYRNIEQKTLTNLMILKGYVDLNINDFGNYDTYTENNIQVSVKNDFLGTLKNAFGLNILLLSPIILLISAGSAIFVSNLVLSPLSKAESISHELKTPLTRATSSLQVISDSANPKLKRSLEKVTQDLIQLGGNVDTLLTLSMYKKQNAILAKSSNLEDEFEKVRSLIPSNLKLNCKITKNLVVPLSSNFTNIILRNLLENASKYNIQGGYINFNASKTGDSWKICVVNPKGVKNNKIGYGLGMNIVREICHYHKLHLNQTITNGVYKVEIIG